MHSTQFCSPNLSSYIHKQLAVVHNTERCIGLQIKMNSAQVQVVTANGHPENVVTKQLERKGTARNVEWEGRGEIFEYVGAANPAMSPIPVMGLRAVEHETGPTRVITLDASKELEIEGYQASSPNLLASFLRICVGDSLTTSACATSQAFYVIHGRGRTSVEDQELEWKTGDLFVIPGGKEDTSCTHECFQDEKTGGAGLYWVSDSPLLAYLGVVPKGKKFDATFFRWEKLLESVDTVRHEPGAEHRNRLGILLGNVATPQTKTLTHTLWSLLNVLPAGDIQRPHRHNSVALDLAIYASPDSYTLMGRELDGQGNVLNPVRVDWESGAMFVTPPGWWHSHHNDSGEDAWVLPLQDAGLYTHQRTLDIRFSEQEIQLLDQKIVR
ncbi:hypothetical protein O6H91_02G099500 [Diphasiastrum complanatum]|uniref:Uncharacterized protein n=1 Tax=Diphasiastrum complanatum TaxID=34168 RepID=A0ACC2EIH8_DIPCM|nr:hypothetical protein O6H91_02G099500 [Diphasiastrum complanatum]